MNFTPPLRRLVHNSAAAFLSGHSTSRSSTDAWNGYDGALDFPSVHAALQQWERVYNTIRPRQALEGYAPFGVSSTGRNGKSRIDRMLIEEDYFSSRDGLRLCFVSAKSRVAQGNVKAVLAVIHGIAYHASPYIVSLQRLVPDAFQIVGLDLRGHGHSDGIRGVTLDRVLVAKDIEDWLALLRERIPGVPIILLGESMGAAYALWYVRHHRPNLAGLVLVAPACVVAGPQLLSFHTIGDFFKSIIRPTKPVIALKGWRLGIASDDLQYVQQHRSDPWALNAVSAAYFMDIVASVMSNLLSATNVDFPVLVLHGASDKVLSPIGSRILSKRIRARSVRLDILPGANHSFLVDSTSAVHLHGLWAWLEDLVR